MLRTDGHRLPGQDVGTWSCASLGDYIESLLEATTVYEMSEAATNLRWAAASVCKLLTHPQPMTDQVFDPSGTDPRWRRGELVELAVDVVTAVDYLLSLLDSSAAMPSSLVLADDAGFGREASMSEGAQDRLTRRRLDARGTAVRRGMRLLGRIACDAHEMGDPLACRCSLRAPANDAALKCREPT